jgi:iron complex transport system permease protein
VDDHQPALSGRGRHPRSALLLLMFAALAVCSVIAGLLAGSVALPFNEIAGVLFKGEDGPARDILFVVRLPRISAGFACGGLLALAGALLQVLLRNPLADPYVLGISGGAGLGLLGATALGLSYAASQAAGFGGALLAVFAVFGLSFRGGEWNLYRLLLTGVVFSSGCGALISLLLTLAPQAAVKGMLFWLLGDLSTPGSARWAWLVLIVLAVVTTIFSGALNVLSLGRNKAASLGVSVLRSEVAIYAAACAATVTCVTLAGTIGFVGLIVPHVLRLLGVTDYRWLIPSAVVLGGAFLSLADTVARTWWAPLQIPVGVVTALLGVPLVLLLLARRP